MSDREAAYSLMISIADARRRKEIGDDDMRALLECLGLEEGEIGTFMSGRPLWIGDMQEILAAVDGWEPGNAGRKP